MTTLAAYLFIAGLVVMGKGILSFSESSSEKPAGVPEALAVGSAALGYELFLLNFCGLILTRQRFLAVLGLDLGLALAAVRFGSWMVFSRETVAWITKRRPMLSTASIVLLFVAFLTAWMEASALPLYHLDALAHFGFEAKILFYKGTFRTPFFFDKTIVHEGPNYPLLVPYLEAAYYGFIGRLEDGAVRHLFLAWWLAWMALIYRVLRQKLEEDLALPLLTVLGSLPVFFADHPGQAVSGCGDVPFALLWSAAVFGVLRWLAADEHQALWVAALASLGVVFCKPNGLPLVVGLWGLTVIFQPARKRPQTVSVLAAILVLLSPWFWEHSRIPRELIEAPIDWKWSSLLQDLHRIPFLIGGSLREMFQPALWGGFWLFVVFSMAFGHKAERTLQDRLLSSVLVLQLAAYYAFYVISPESVHTVVVWTLTRWLTHLSGPLMVWCGWRWADRYPGR